MKKFIQKSKVLLKLSYLLAFFAMVYSCQTEELAPGSTDASTNKNGTTVVKTSLTAPVITKITTGDCSKDCIAPAGPYFTTTDQKTVSWGGPNNDKFVKTVNVEYYNTSTDFI